MNRGSTAGTVTRAKRVRPCRSTVTATFVLRLARNGSGRPGLERQRRQHRRDIALEHAREVFADVGGPVGPIEHADAGGFEQASQVVPDVRLVLQHPAGARLHGGQLLLGVLAVGPNFVRHRRSASSACVDTRIMKNSSRFDAVMARNFTRSSSGCAASRAWSSTRSLNSSQLSSRLM